MRTIHILEDYELRIAENTGNSVVGEIVHCRTTPAGTTHRIEIGKLSARSDVGDNDAFRPHWKIAVFLECGNEYDPVNNVTISPNLMERKHWESEGVSITEGPLPKYHPDLPNASVRSLIGEGYCSEPILAQVYHCEIDQVLDDFGNVAYDCENGSQSIARVAASGRIQPLSRSEVE